MFSFIYFFQLGQIISKEIDPKSSKPSDVKVLKTLIPLMEKSVAFLVKYNESGNASIDYFNITESLGKEESLQ